jgi:hypothetical protein
MAFGGMRTSGPNCCCCNDLYSLRNLSSPQRTELVRLRLAGEEITAVTTVDTDDFATPLLRVEELRMDWLNKRVYGIAKEFVGGSTTFTWRVFSISENLDDYQVIVTGDTNALHNNTFGVWPHPDTEEIFYTVGDNSTAPPFEMQIRKVDYDGSNDTLLVTHTGIGVHATNKATNTPCVPRDGSFLYYMVRPALASNFHEIRQCGLDGSGDTAVYTAPNDATVSNIISLYIDNDHEKLTWVEFTSGTPQFARCDFDGSNVERYFTPPAAGISRIPFWSHKKQKTFWYTTTAGTNRGFWSVEYDGTGSVKLVDDANMPANYQSANPLTPGCGFDITGEGYRV